jgi:hypothetical protein
VAAVPARRHGVRARQVSRPIGDRRPPTGGSSHRTLGARPMSCGPSQAGVSRSEEERRPHGTAIRVVRHLPGLSGPWRHPLPRMQRGRSKQWHRARPVRPPAPVWRGCWTGTTAEHGRENLHLRGLRLRGLPWHRNGVLHGLSWTRDAGAPGVHRRALLARARHARADPQGQGPPCRRPSPAACAANRPPASIPTSSAPTACCGSSGDPGSAMAASAPARDRR